MADYATNWKLDAAFDKLRQRFCPQRSRWLSLSKPARPKLSRAIELCLRHVSNELYRLGECTASCCGKSAIYNLESTILNGKSTTSAATSATIRWVPGALCAILIYANPSGP